MKSKEHAKLYKHISAIGGSIVLLIVSYYMNMQIDVKSIIPYLKAKSL